MLRTNGDTSKQYNMDNVLLCDFIHLHTRALALYMVSCCPVGVLLVFLRRKRLYKSELIQPFAQFLGNMVRA